MMNDLKKNMFELINYFSLSLSLFFFFPLILRLSAKGELIKTKAKQKKQLT